MKGLKEKAPKPSKEVLTSIQEEEFKKLPHSFVFHRGKVGRNVIQLEQDLRKLMEPYTARNLKIRKKNVLKDFVGIAGPLHVSHFMVFSRSEETTNLRLMRLPRGPTLTFRVQQYGLVRDVVSSLKRHAMESKQFLHSPLLVMNNFSGEGRHLKLMTTMFQNMFPSINVNKVKLKDIKRCVLLNYNPEDKTVDFRHYNIRVVPVGMSRGVKKIVKARVPNLSKYDDVSEFLLKGDVSESEAELDGPHNEVELPQDMSSRGNIKAAKSAIRLTEIGPRMVLRLIKIEEGISDGKVIYHDYITKTSEELQTQEKVKAKKIKLKEDRKRQQEENVDKKQKEKKATTQTKAEKEVYDGEPTAMASEESDMDDDSKYYQQEVGEAPDPDMFPKGRGQKRKKPRETFAGPLKKLKDKNPRDREIHKKHSQKSGKESKSPNKFQNKGGKTKDFKKGPRQGSKTRPNEDRPQKGGKKWSNTGAKGSKNVVSKKGKSGSFGRDGQKVDGKNREKSKDKKKPLTEMDKMKRSKQMRMKRKEAKLKGKRSNKPRKT